MPVGEVATPYNSRPEGSVSKLRTYRDGWRILQTILNLYRLERPLTFYSVIAGSAMVVALGLALPLGYTYLQTGMVPRFPTAILATGMGILAALSLACGLILDTVTRGRQEMRRLIYLTAE